MKFIELNTHIIRLGTYEDIPIIIEFIKNEWNPNHIFVKSRSFFEYEHYINGNVNGILAVDKESGKLDGILMFYQTQKILENSDFFGGIWCVRKKCKVPMIGYKMVESVKSLTKTRGHSGIGINPNTTARIFRHISGQFVGKLHHFYKLSDQGDYRVAVINHKDIRPAAANLGRCELVPLLTMERLLNDFNVSAYKDNYPFKDEWYIEKRYYNHPIYNYKVFGISVAGEVKGILVTRVVEHNGGKVLRIIDFLGEKSVFGQIGKPLEELMVREKYEYADFYEYGLDIEKIENAGFVELTKDDSNVIPNYFEPFEQRNIDIWFHTPYKNYMLFKGDGDQDRPNILG